jgi:alpha-glucuronidase
MNVFSRYIYLLIIAICASSFSLKGEAQLWMSANSNVAQQYRLVEDAQLGSEGFRIIKKDNGFLLCANTEQGLLYGHYALARLSATGALDTLRVHTEVPAYNLRILNHWDNLDGTVERGYAGNSLWRWSELPDTISPRYRDYAKACASVGINGSVLNNVNASPLILTDQYVTKVAAIANVLREFGVRVYLSVNFASPMVIGACNTADPLNPDVQQWWQNKVDSIYEKIPDFGGFLVKANSEGQPGPCDYARSHADGANMLARALAPHHGIVMWRAFVYSPSDADRAKQAFLEFNPLDGKFDDNVIIQIKNGPIDFQPREPISALFFGMPNTNVMAEFQITQEYLGHSNHVVFLAPMWQEFFSSISQNILKGVAGVANIGNSDNFTANTLAQANWYAFGRLAWNPQLSPKQIAYEWTRLSFENVPDSIVNDFSDMLCGTREAVVNYMMPLGLHHLFAWGHHYGPEPWCEIENARPDWLPKYYHRADSLGLGFDRSSHGSNAVDEYPAIFARFVDNIESCPDEYLLWFHHASWTHKMQSGRSLWHELCFRYASGIDFVSNTMIPTWLKMRPYVDTNLYNDISKRLQTQLKDAIWWRDACLLYFQQFSNLPIPPQYLSTPINHTLDKLMQIHLPISNFECPSAELLDSVR